MLCCVIPSCGAEACCTIMFLYNSMSRSYGVQSAVDLRGAEHLISNASRIGYRVLAEKLHYTRF
jgi:hypothetical protein